MTGLTSGCAYLADYKPAAAGKHVLTVRTDEFHGREYLVQNVFGANNSG